MRLLAFCVLVSFAGLSAAANPADLLSKIKSVAKEGAGNQEAGAAWKELVASGGDAILPTLAAMDDATPIASNWLRSAANALAEKEVAAGKKLPTDQLEAFVLDSKHSPTSRRLAYELLVDVDAKTPGRLLPGMVNDPSVELRRDAIADAMLKGATLEGDKAKAEFNRLFAAVRDKDQAEKIQKELEKHGIKPDFQKHFGVISNWMLTGPFDCPKETGFEKANAPEEGVDLTTDYKGKDDAVRKWKAHQTKDPYGTVDLNKELGKHKDAAAYAYATVESDKEQQIEIRFGCICAIKVFLNGKQLFAREEYHHGERFDQYSAKAMLKAGQNGILVKVCQNNQSEPWAQNWQFQLRLCDATGGAAAVKPFTVTK